MHEQKCPIYIWVLGNNFKEKVGLFFSHLTGSSFRHFHVFHFLYLFRFHAVAQFQIFGAGFINLLHPLIRIVFAVQGKEQDIFVDKVIIPGTVPLHPDISHGQVCQIVIATYFKNGSDGSGGPYIEGFPFLS